MDTNRVLGALYGHLLGDALGVPYEFRFPADIEWTVSDSRLENEHRGLLSRFAGWC